MGFANGKTEDVKIPVEAWFLGNHYRYDRQFASELTSVVIDPDRNFPDIRASNNSRKTTP
jgi:hypothetical protein